MGTAYMFPGQGSQSVGMREKIGAMSDRQKDLFARADDILGYSLSDLIDRGPEDELTRTSNAQPALLVTGIAFAMALDERGMKADAAMGHSLGEYTALVHAGVISFDDGVRIVRRRGELMEEAVRDTPGKMAAVIGMQLHALEEVIARCRVHGVIEITNFNSPSQVVLSGERAAVDHAVRAINEGGTAKAIELNVSAPFHSSLMKPIAETFGSFLADVEFHPPRCRFIDNVTGGLESSPEAIRRKLVDQLSSPVQWERAVRTAVETGIDTFIEAGPGTVLSGLVKRIAKGVKVMGAESILKRE